MILGSGLCSAQAVAETEKGRVGIAERNTLRRSLQDPVPGIRNSYLVHKAVIVVSSIDQYSNNRRAWVT
jgi:hypothetical protein